MPDTGIVVVENISRERTAETADLSTTLLRSSGRDDKGEGGDSGECGGRTGAVFIASGGPKAHDFSGRDDKGGLALPETVVAEQDPFY